jgi:hypothetical protein
MLYKWHYIKSIITSIGATGELTESQLIEFAKNKRLFPDKATVETIEGLLSEKLLSAQRIEGQEIAYSLTDKGKRLYEVIQDYPSLHPYYEEIYAKTVCDETLSRELEFVRGFFEEWAGNFLHPFGDDLLDGNKLNNSVYYCYLATQTAVFDWLTHSLIFGHYEVVLRELRTVLEGLFPAYYLDITYPDESLDDKLEKLAEMEADRVAHGRRAFAMSGVAKWQDYYSLYRELCAYVHLSRKVAGARIDQIAEKGFGESLDASFNRDRFLECTTAWQKIAALSANLAGSLLDKLGVERFQTNSEAFDKI